MTKKENGADYKNNVPTYPRKSARCALYARVSKGDDSQDPENQLIRLRRWAEAMEYDVETGEVGGATPADEFARDIHAECPKCGGEMVEYVDVYDRA